jgi:hypothetical protein
MEWKYCVITESQNTRDNGYGPNNQKAGAKDTVWKDFYGVDHFHTFDEAKTHYNEIEARAAAESNPEKKSEILKEHRFIAVEIDGPEGIKQIAYLDKVAYRARMKASIESSLEDANTRAEATGKKAYVHATGLGLGFWALGGPRGSGLLAQANLLAEVYRDVITSGSFDHIADVDFSWFPEGTKFECDNGKLLKQDKDNRGEKYNEQETYRGVNIHFSNRNPGDKLEGQNANKLLVGQYAWDGATYPGNEYWGGSLDASGDPAAACFSTIPELQNPLVNGALRFKGLQRQEA